MATQRTLKAASLVQQIVAAALIQEVADARMTVKSVDVSPDMRTATAWIGVAADPSEVEQLFERVLGAQGRLQEAVAARLETKFVPRLRLKLDDSGAYADHINQLMKGL